jgi:hypothetical protein
MKEQLGILQGEQASHLAQLGKKSKLYLAIGSVTGDSRWKTNVN